MSSASEGERPRIDLPSGVHRVETIELAARAGRWAWAQDNAAAIEAHWQTRSAANPMMFNGPIFMLDQARLSGGAFTGRLLRTNFASFLYWRDHGEPDCGVRDCFGSALLRSSEGHILLGRQRAGQVNSGLAYLPGGFIDARDVDASGRVCIGASILREVGEETGLDAAVLRRRPGYLMTVTGSQVSLAAELVSPEPTARMRQRILDFLRRDPASELVDIVVIDGPARAAAEAMPNYARVLLRALLDAAPEPR